MQKDSMINKASRPCPFLGLAEDPETSQAFPSANNFCHRAEPSAPVNMDHQLTHCLSGRYQSCPMLEARTPGPLPPQLNYSAPNRLSGRVISGGVIVGLLIAAAIFFIYSIFERSQASGQIPGNNGGIAGETPSPTLVVDALEPLSSPSASPTQPTEQVASSQGTAPPTSEIQSPTLEPSTATPVQENPPTATQNSSGTEPACGPPDDWVEYTVQAGDTLFGLSVVLDVSVAALQQANCLGDNTVINVGQVLFVPFLPPTRLPATQAPSNTPKPPTEVPPTQEPTSPPPSPTPLPSETPVPLPTDTPLPPTPTETPPLRATPSPTGAPS